MSRTHIAAYVFPSVGAMLFLMGLLALPVVATEGKVPPLQPSPRPTLAPRPTLTLPTLTPTAIPSTPVTPTTEAGSESATPSVSQTPTPAPALMPNSGGTSQSGWLFGLGVGAILLGLALVLLQQGRA
jgi:hypothetical protein